MKPWNIDDIDLAMVCVTLICGVAAASMWGKPELFKEVAITISMGIMALARGGKGSGPNA